MIASYRGSLHDPAMRRAEPSKAARVARAGWVVLLLASLRTAYPQETSAPTQWRFSERIFIHAKAGQQVTARIGAFSASVGYSDWLTYKLLSPKGDVLRSSSLKLGEFADLSFKAEVTGVYTLDSNAGNNGFTFDAPRVKWVATPSFRPDYFFVTGHARRLYFFVPERLTEFNLTLGGEEAAKARVLRPDGTVAADLDLEYVKAQDITLKTNGDSGKSWSLEFELKEDMDIKLDKRLPMYLSETPLTAEDLRQFENSKPQTFDMLPVPPTSRQQSPSVAVAELKVGNELRIAFGQTGQVARLRAKGADLLPKEGVPFSGFALRDLQRGIGVWPVAGRMRKSGSVWQQSVDLKELSLKLDATFSAKGDHIEVDGELADMSGHDRAVSLYFALPVSREGAVWWDDIDRRTDAEPTKEYSNWGSVAAGGNNHNSVYPFACVAGRGGIAMAVPMNRPVLHRLGYNAARQQFYLCFDFALTRATTKFPGKAAFRFVIYPVDPAWGFRSAADRYYRIHPQFFEKRAPDGALLGGLMSKPDPTPTAQAAAKIGYAYVWSAEGVPAIAAAHKAGLLPWLYNDSVRYFIYLTTPPEKTPPRAEISADMESFLKAPNPQELYLGRPEVKARLEKLRDFGWYGLSWEELTGEKGNAALLSRNTAVLKSAFHDASGLFIPTYYVSAADDKRYYGYNIHTARVLCNPDPDLPDGWGKALLDDDIGGSFRRAEAGGTRLEGVALDNYFVNAKDLNFRTDHYAYTDHPLTFAPDLRPVQVGDFCTYEWLEALAKRLRAKGQMVSANTGNIPFPFAMTWIDVNLFEWGVENNGPIGRTLAYHRPVVSLPVQPDHYTEAWVKKSHLRFGFLPGGNPNAKLDPIYQRYVPVLKRLSGAGWEPITLAATNDPEVLVERFGSWKTHNLCFTLFNRSDKNKEFVVRLDRKGLGLDRPRDLRMVDIVENANLNAPINEAGGFTLRLGPQDTKAFAVQ